MGESIIIELPERQTLVQWAISVTITFVLWGIWTYLWLPVLPCINWLLGTNLQEQNFILRGYIALLDALPLYLAVISSLGGSLLAWALYNYVRFRGVERRRGAPEVALPELSTYSAVEETHLSAWQRARRLVLHHDETGQLSHAVVTTQ